MTGTYDTEQQRMIDRIKCITFREAHDAGAIFINKQWIVDKIHRTTRFASEWWEKSYSQCFADYSTEISLHYDFRAERKEKIIFDRTTETTSSKQKNTRESPCFLNYSYIF